MDSVDFDRVEIEAIDEYCELLNANSLVSMTLIRQRSSIFVDLAILFPYYDERQQFLVNKIGLNLTLKVGEEHFAKLLNGNQALFVFNHFIQLLLKVVKDAVIHYIAIDFFKDRRCWHSTRSHYPGEIAINEVTAHGVGPLLSVNDLLLVLALTALT